MVDAAAARRRLQKKTREEEQHESAVRDETGRRLLQPDEVVVQYDEEGEPVPYRVPVIGHAGVEAGERSAVVKPLPLSVDRKQMRAYAEIQDAVERGEAEKVGDYIVREDGTDIGIAARDPVPYSVIRECLGDYLIRPDLGPWRTADEMLEDLTSLPLALALNTTVRVYGTGRQIVYEDEERSRRSLVDKKK